LGYFREVRCVPPRRGFPWEFLRRNFAGKILPYEPSRKPFPWGYATRGRGGYEGRKVGKQCGLKRYRRGKCILTCINTYFKYEAQFVGRKKTCWCVRLECTFAYMHGSVSLSRTLDGRRQRLEPHSVLQCVALFQCVLHCVAACCSVSKFDAVCISCTILGMFLGFLCVALYFHVAVFPVCGSAMCCNLNDVLQGVWYNAVHSVWYSASGGGNCSMCCRVFGALQCVRSVQCICCVAVCSVCCSVFGVL